MKKRLKAIFIQLFTAVRQNPVEVLLSVVFCCIGCLNNERWGEGSYQERLLTYFPVIFLLTNMLNRITIRGKIRWPYFLTVLLCIPFFWVETKMWSASYIVTLIVVQLLYLLSAWQRGNNEFVRSGLRYLYAFLSSWLLSGIIYLLAISIYFSIRYIFEIWMDYENRFLECMAYVAFMGILPLLFLMFHQENEEETGENKLFDVLINYILSPALLIYAVILYLYFVKIAVFWSLPKGAVAYIVVSFVTATFILKGFQPFLSKRYYDWFYKYASLIVLPALAMYWAGACYRINQYGFTEPRVYLVVVGLILTGVVILFFSKRLGRYLYTAILAVLLLSAVTYIPGITANDIEIMSQKSRGNYPPKEADDRYSSFQMENTEVLDISDYQTLQPVKSYRSPDAMWLETKADSIFLYNKVDSLIMKSDLSRFIKERMATLGLSAADSIPVSIYPQMLRFEMDSDLLIFESISLHRYSSDSVYKVSYVEPGYYLTKKK